MFKLKPLSPDGVERALSRIERYRLLNEPWRAESICRDVLETEPHNQQATIGLILSLSDQFATAGGAALKEAQSLVSELDSEYDRAYYSGIICERRATALFRRKNPGSGQMAHQLLREAMDWFEQADHMHPTGNEDAVLRFNTCARLLMKHPELQSAPDDDFHPMLE